MKMEKMQEEPKKKTCMCAECSFYRELSYSEDEKMWLCEGCK